MGGWGWGVQPGRIEAGGGGRQEKEGCRGSQWAGSKTNGEYRPINNVNLSKL